MLIIHYCFVTLELGNAADLMVGIFNQISFIFIFHSSL